MGGNKTENGGDGRDHRLIRIRKGGNTFSLRLLLVHCLQPETQPLMFSCLPQVNQLTRLLLSHGIRHFVVCPGARNAPIVHNLYEAAGCGYGELHIIPVTDERSAGFTALGVALAAKAPCVVCVTSGSALLNLLPSVAEAYYRHVPLIVVSADRPAQWIGQLDGQTLPQPGALLPYAQTCNLVEVKESRDQLANNHLLNKALLPLKLHCFSPVHINVPLSEPLFVFDRKVLPEERIIRVLPAFHKRQTFQPSAELEELLRSARLPAIYMGQYEKPLPALRLLKRREQMLVLAECIANQGEGLRLWATDEQGEVLDSCPTPDLVVQMGGNLVHKHWKLHMRAKHNCHVVFAGERELQDLPDTLSSLCYFVEVSPEDFIEYLATTMPLHNPAVMEASAIIDNTAEALWLELKSGKTFDYYSIMATLRHRLDLLGKTDVPPVLHLANSKIVRAASAAFSGWKGHVECNRGTNGIDGSVSTAAGFSLCSKSLNVLVTGDLSFFYDSNGLWNEQLGANFRILILNNHRGAIFDQLAGLKESAAFTGPINGAHSASASQVAAAYACDFREVKNPEELGAALDFLLSEQSEKPRVVEVLL